MQERKRGDSNKRVSNAKAASLGLDAAVSNICRGDGKEHPAELCGRMSLERHVERSETSLDAGSTVAFDRNDLRFASLRMTG